MRLPAKKALGGPNLPNTITTNHSFETFIIVLHKPGKPETLELTGDKQEKTTYGQSKLGAPYFCTVLLFWAP